MLSQLNFFFDNCISILKMYYTLFLRVLFCFVFGLFAFFRAEPVAYGGSQASGQIRAAAADLHNRHSKLRLRPTPQLMAVPDP